MTNSNNPYYFQEPSKGENGYHLANYKTFAQRHWLNKVAQNKQQFGQLTKQPKFRPIYVYNNCSNQTQQEEENSSDTESSADSQTAKGDKEENNVDILFENLFYGTPNENIEANIVNLVKNINTVI